MNSPVGCAKPLAPPQTRRLRHLAVVLTALFGIIASIGVFLIIGTREYRIAKISFEDHARDRLRIMASDFKDSSGLLYNLRAYMASADGMVSRSEFIRFSAALHADILSLRDTGWAPRVTAAERADFEQQVRNSGFPDFQITERDSAGTVMRAGDRSEYFPILYTTEGASAAARLLGLDVAFEPLRRSAIHRTIETAKPAATPPLRLATVPGPRGGLMAFMALNDKGAGDGVVTRGVVLGVFDLVAMIDNIVSAKAMLTGLKVYFFEPGAGLDALSNHQRTSGSNSGITATQRELLAGPHWSGTVPIMDQQWTAIFVPAEPLAGNALWHWQTMMPLVTGLTMTAMIVAYLLVSVRRTAQLEALTFSLNRTMETMNHMVRHDLLTGSPNRVLFKERLDEAVANLRCERGFALLFLDLDKFKAVNDTLGHAAGDQLLRIATARMLHCLRDTDTLARLGGDEFAAILSNRTTSSDVAMVAHRLIETVSQPYQLDGHVATIGVSVGIAIAPDDGDAPEILQLRADLALYAAKNAGRGTVKFFYEQSDATTEA